MNKILAHIEMRLYHPNKGKYQYLAIFYADRAYMNPNDIMFVWKLDVRDIDYFP